MRARIRWTHTLKTEVVLLAVTTAGGPTHGGAKMTGGRSPPQLCFSLFWLESSSTAAALARRSLCSAPFEPPLLMHRTRRKQPGWSGTQWRRSSLASFEIGLRFRSLNFLDSDCDCAIKFDDVDDCSWVRTARLTSCVPSYLSGAQPPL